MSEAGCLPNQPDADICRNCHKRPAIHNWVGDGGVLAHIHGLTTRYCDVCALEAQVEHAMQSAERLPDLRARLAAALVKYPIVKSVESSHHSGVATTGFSNHTMAGGCGVSAQPSGAPDYLYDMCPPTKGTR